MTDEQQRNAEIDRADQARAVLENPLVKEVFEIIERDLISAWRSTDRKDVEGREKAWVYYLTLHRFRDTFLQFVETGRMARLQLDERKRFRLFSRW